jgi:ribosome biogenesis SPOUT family RNA methylase Rps3
MNLWTEIPSASSTLHHLLCGTILGDHGRRQPTTQNKVVLDAKAQGRKLGTGEIDRISRGTVRCINAARPVTYQQGKRGQQPS